jgi:hypothetical protein
LEAAIVTQWIFQQKWNFHGISLFLGHFLRLFKKC